jgi:hypothetical protein
MSQASSVRAEVDALEEGLLQAAVPSGGWPYQVGRTPRLEPTAWGVLALASVPGRQAVESARESALGWLASIQREDGLLVEPGTPGPNYGWNGLALLAAAAGRDTDKPEMRRRLTDGLLGAKGVRLPPGPAPVQQDNTLQAWSWTEGTFSWIEPTAYCLLALKRAGIAGEPALAPVRADDRAGTPGAAGQTVTSRR